MKELAKKLLDVLDGREHKKFILLFVAILLMAVLQVVGIASVMPFMSLVTDPGLVHENEWLNWAYETFGFQSERSFLIAAGAAVLVFIAASNGFILFSRWLQFRVTWDVAHSLATRLLKTYTAQPYVYFLMHNSSDMGKQVLAEVKQFVTGFLFPLMQLVARSIVALLIFALLIYVNPQLALTVFCVIGGVYVLIYVGIRRRLAKMGEERTRTVKARFKAANEVLAGIKPVKVHNCETHFTERFVAASRTYSSMQARYKIMGQAPRFLVEILAFGGIIAIVLYLLVTRQGGVEQIIPLLSLYALAGYRLLPALQSIYSSAAGLRYKYSLVDEIHRDLKQVTSAFSSLETDTSGEMAFDDAITLHDVTFQYPGAGEAALRDINLNIAKSTSIALVGSTGSGKTTLVDIIMGLLQPQEGQVYVDDVPLTPANVHQWTNIVGYVPQDVFFFDDTVIRNIAFGLEDEAIDLNQVKRAAEIANVHTFIEQELPRGYDTIIGERGVRLSGGQRQRLGLARALYHEPKVLILDEATSALDGITEEAVMGAIQNLPYEVTMITIAHRIATVKDCDYLYLLENGRIVERGTYQELVETNAKFREMARLTVSA